MADMAVDQHSGQCRLDDVRALLSLGSNAADAYRRVAALGAMLASRYIVEAQTRIFVTPDIHMSILKVPQSGVPAYANAVVRICMPRVPLRSASTAEFNHDLKAIEYEAGRRKEHKEFGLVNADIDQVIVGSRILRPADFLRPYFFPAALEL